MMIHIYAEHLVHIRTLSIQASLSSVSEATTRATISSDGQSILLNHAGENASLTLPARVPIGFANTALRISQVGSKDISFRIPLATPQNEHGPAGKPVLDDDADLAPWSARELTADVRISCSACQTTIVERGRIKLWKDLPSENWAEMMDFWHCHRPHVPDSHDAQGALKKGYAADSKLALLPGVGMVDHGHFVMHPDDCVGVETTTDTASGGKLQCSTCKTPLGSIDTSSGGHKLLKSHLALSPSASASEPQSYSAELWLTAHLLTAVSTQGVRKFCVATSPTTTPSSSRPQSALNLWIFTPDLTISSTLSSSNAPLRVAKILWRQVESDDDSMDIDEGRLDRKALSQGHLEIPEEGLVALGACLERSAALLPASAREFMGWRVGLLERFPR